MRKMYVLILFAFCTLAACNTNSAMLYNNMIVEKETSLLPEISKVSGKLEMFSKEEKYDSVLVIANHMIDLIKGKVKEVSDVPEPGARGVAAFKKAYIEYFGFLESIYQGYKNVSLAKTDEERSAEWQKLAELGNTQQVAVKKLQTAQRRFADDNGFKVDVRGK